MNKHNAKYYLPLVQALAEGKVIQIKCHPDADGLWVDTPEVTDVFQPNMYRIKPEPRKAWVWWPPTGSDDFPVAHRYKQWANDWAETRGGHITEVTEHD